MFILDDKELYGQGVAGLFKQRCEKLGLKILGHESINTKQNEFRSLMTKIKAKNPDVVYFGGTTQSKGGQIAKDMRDAGLDLPADRPGRLLRTAFIESAGEENLKNCYVTIGGIDPSAAEGPRGRVRQEVQGEVRQRPGGLRGLRLRGREGRPRGDQEGRQEGPRGDPEGALDDEGLRRGRARQVELRRERRHQLQNMTISKVEDGKFKPVKIVDRR